MWKSNRKRFDSVRELQEAINELPLLRAPRTGIDPRRTVVACHASDLEKAVASYGQRLKHLPVFHVLNLPAAPLTDLPKILSRVILPILRQAWTCNCISDRPKRLDSAGLPN